MKTKLILLLLLCCIGCTTGYENISDHVYSKHYWVVSAKEIETRNVGAVHFIYLNDGKIMRMYYVDQQTYNTCNKGDTLTLLE